MKMKPSTLILAAAAAFVSCQKSETGAVEANPVNAPSAELAAVVDAVVEGKPQAIHLVRTTAKPGETVTLSGRVMGNESPFVEGRAAFILGDPEVLTPCNENPDDPCETPWDVCCDTPEDKKRGTATIQVVDADGRVLKEGLEGVAGIGKLSKLTVTGEVAEGSNEEVLVLNATAIDVEE